MEMIENVFYTDNNSLSQALDIYLPDAENFPVFVYFHGGGIEKGDKSDNRERCFYECLQKKGVAVLPANYSMYPHASFPDFLKDAAAAVAWAKKHMPEYGNVTGLFIGGSSAGGYISQMLCFDKKYLSIHKIDSDEISGYIFDAGQPTVHFNVLRERGIDPRRVVIDEDAPIYHIKDGRDYPPMQIFVAEDDMKNRYEQTQLLLSTLKHFEFDMSKIDYKYMKGYKHCKYTIESDENGHSAFADTVFEFINKYSKKGCK